MAKKGTLYKIGQSGGMVDKVADALMSGGYLSSYGGKYDKNMANAIKNYKKATGGSNAYGNTFGNGTMNKLFREQPQSNMDAYKAFEYQWQQNNGYKDSLRDGFEANKRAINGGYDNSARQYYVQSRQNEKELPEQLSNLGVSGGTTESALLKLQSAYGSNLQKNESDRNSQLANAESAYNSDLAGYESNLQSQLANAYMSAAMADIEYKRQLELDKAAQISEAKEKQRVDRWNTSMNKKIAQLKGKGKSVQTTKWSDGTLHYNSYYKPKTGKKKVSSGKGSSGSGGKSSNGTSSKSSKSSSLNNSVNNKVVTNYNDFISNYGARQIVQKYTNGTLSKAEANKKLSLYGVKISGDSLMKTKR